MHHANAERNAHNRPKVNAVSTIRRTTKARLVAGVRDHVWNTMDKGLIAAATQAAAIIPSSFFGFCRNNLRARQAPSRTLSETRATGRNPNGGQH
jgi:hypothetical protein